MYFSILLGLPRSELSVRCNCSSNVKTRGGRSPRRPSASRSASVNAVPLLSSGLVRTCEPVTGGGSPHADRPWGGNEEDMRNAIRSRRARLRVFRQRLRQI